MEVKAIAKQAPISPKRARLILDEIRGKRIDEALALLRFMPTPHARLIAKVVRSAAANAESNYSLDPRNLRIAAAYAGDSVRLKRLLPLYGGRAATMQRRRSNITVVVAEKGR